LHPCYREASSRAIGHRPKVLRVNLDYATEQQIHPRQGLPDDVLIKGTKNPLSSVSRMLKALSYGYRVVAGYTKHT
jgi:hypothetical protein